MRLRRFFALGFFVTLACAVLGSAYHFEIGTRLGAVLDNCSVLIAGFCSIPGIIFAFGFVATGNQQAARKKEGLPLDYRHL